MSTLLTIAVLGLILAPFGRWYWRGSFREDASQAAGSDDFTMKPTRRHRIFVVGVLTFPALFGVCVAIVDKANAGVGWLFGGMSLLFAPFVLPTLFRSIAVSSRGLRAWSPWTGGKEIAWADVAAVWFREWGQTIRIKDTSGRTIVVPNYVSGMRQLEKALLAHRPAVGASDAFQKLQKHLAAL